MSQVATTVENNFLLIKTKNVAMAIPNELIKTGGTDGRQIGSKVLIDSSKHMTQLSRLTLESGQSFSQHGLDLHGANITRVHELEVDVLRAKQVIGLEALEPQNAGVTAVTEFPDDMVVESLQCAALTITQIPNSSLVETDTQGQLRGISLLGSSAVITDASGHLTSTKDLTQFVTFPVHAPPLPPPPPPLLQFAPNSALITDASGHLIATDDLTKFVTIPAPAPAPVSLPPPPPPPLQFAPNSALITDASGHLIATDDLTKFVTLPAPVPASAPANLPPNSNVVTNADGELATQSLDSFVRCPVASLPNHVPRFATTNGMLASSSVYVDGEGNMSGLNKIEALRADLGEMVNTDTLHAVSSKLKTLQTEKINLGNAFVLTSFSTNLYVSNGAFQAVGIGGEGAYICNLRLAGYSIYCQVSIGKTKTGHRTAFGPVGGVKSSQLVEYESQNGYDFLLMDLPEVGKISFGAEQKTGEFAIRSDQVDLINVDVHVQRNYVFTLPTMDDS